MVHNWVSRVYLPNSVIRASSRTASWKRSSHSTLDRTNSASSSSARISSRRRMAADWGVKSGSKTRRSTSGRVRYRRRMKPSSVAGIAPKHSRIFSGLRPRRRALEIRDRDTSIPHRTVITLPNSSSVPGVTSKAPTATMRRKAAVNGPSELPDFTPAARRASTLNKPTKKEEQPGLVHAPPLQFVTAVLVREFERRGSQGGGTLSITKPYCPRLATVPYCGTDEPDTEIVRRAVLVARAIAR